MKKAQLYRMSTAEHVCPFGRKSLWLLRRRGYQVDDHLLKTREATDAFKEKHGVKTTPQTFIDGKRIGGYDDLREFFHERALRKKDDVTYMPVISLFGVAALMALAIQWMKFETLDFGGVFMLFGGISMCLLAIQKLKDVEMFSNSFLNYDLLSQSWVRYSYIYPFAELIAGLGMLSGLFPIPVAAIAIFAGTEGTISVIKAVYIDKRDIKCACVGGDSKVPLGFVSLMENLIMIVMGAWLFV